MVDTLAQTEMALVGAILHAPDKLTKMVDLVKCADFTTEAAAKAINCTVKRRTKVIPALCFEMAQA